MTATFPYYMNNKKILNIKNKLILFNNICRLQLNPFLLSFKQNSHRVKLRINHHITSKIIETDPYKYRNKQHF